MKNEKFILIKKALLKNITRILVAVIVFTYLIAAYKNANQPSNKPAPSPLTALPFVSPTENESSLRAIESTNSATGRDLFVQLDAKTKSILGYTGNLILADQKMARNLYPETNPTFVAELHNYDNQNYKNIVVRFSFYKQKNTTCDDPADDNEYVQVSDYIASGDSQVVKALVKTNFDTTHAFIWCANISNYQTVQ